MIVSLVEGLVILALTGCLVKSIVRNGRLRNGNRQKIKEQVLNEKVDFEGLIKGSFQTQEAEKLYNILKVKCHPDRFAPDEEKCRLADGLYQKITANKNNYQRLLELKKEFQTILNIKIN